MFGRRILILVPHPDDEVVAQAAAIGRARATGAEVFTLYLTHGCIARGTLWPWQRGRYEKYIARRLVEAERVALFMDVAPLGWSMRPARYLWRGLPDVYRQIEQTILGEKIDQIWIPAYEGGNADHDALNALGSLFRKQLSVLEFAEYNFFGGQVHSQEFPYPNGTEQVIELTSEERAMKRAALALYKSEKRNLNYVETKRECYRPLIDYDYSVPPHPGTLWYARFHWVPFRHPRVDFTKAEEVSAAILSFVSARATDLPAPARQSDQAHTAKDRGNAG